LAFRIQAWSSALGDAAFYHGGDPAQTMFRVYVTTTSSDPFTTPVYTISYSGTIQVPQSCAINAGNVVEFDFGDIGASLFSKPGPEIARKGFAKTKPSPSNAPTWRRMLTDDAY
jgi:type 1 fimbria pilin